MTMDLTPISAFLVGLLGGVHCVGMCGGIVTALTFGLPRASRTRIGAMLPFQMAYNLGRISSYLVAGAIMGGMGQLLVGLLPVYQTQRVLYLIAGLFMLLLGLYLGGWWLGLAAVERVGARLWRRLGPYGRRLLPVTTLPRAFLLGLIWGWVPCGLVYSALVWAVSSGNSWKGAMLMLAFGLGTLPNLLALGLVAGGLARWSRNRTVRQAAGALVFGFGAFTVWQAL